ncbi:MAG: hypothetical protein WC455_27110 [Dehalococcoidia bacterium]|jgi:hypothetical protein
MMNYKLIPFDQLEDGQEVLAFGVHMTRWNFQEWGNPAYAFVPPEKTEEKESEDQDLGG